MENIEDKIYALMRKSSYMKEIYRNNPHMNDREILSQLEAQSDIEDMCGERPMLKEALLGYRNILALEPVDILQRITYKTDSEIRMEYEEMKKKECSHYVKKDFNLKKGGHFKTGEKESGQRGACRSNPHDFYI